MFSVDIMSQLSPRDIQSLVLTELFGAQPAH